MKTTSFRYLLIGTITLSSQSFAGKDGLPDNPGYAPSASGSSYRSPPRPTHDPYRWQPGNQYSVVPSGFSSVVGAQSHEEDDQESSLDSDSGSYSGSDDEDLSSHAGSDSYPGSDDEEDNAAWAERAAKMKEEEEANHARFMAERARLQAEWEAEKRAYNERKQLFKQNEITSNLKATLRARQSIIDCGENPDNEGLKLTHSIEEARKILTQSGDNPDQFPELRAASAPQSVRTPNRSAGHAASGLTPDAGRVNLSGGSPSASSKRFRLAEGTSQRYSAQRHDEDSDQDRESSPRYRKPVPAKSATTPEQRPRAHEASGTSTSSMPFSQSQEAPRPRYEPATTPAPRPSQPPVKTYSFGAFKLRMASGLAVEVCVDGKNFFTINTNQAINFKLLQCVKLFSHENYKYIMDQLSPQFGGKLLFYQHAQLEDRQLTVVFYVLGDNVPVAVLQHTGQLMLVQSPYQEPLQASHYEALPDDDEESSPQQQVPAGRPRMPLPHELQQHQQFQIQPPHAAALPVPNLQPNRGVARIARGVVYGASGAPLLPGSVRPTQAQPARASQAQPAGGSQDPSQDESERVKGKKKSRSILKFFFGRGNDKKPPKPPK